MQNRTFIDCILKGIRAVSALTGLHVVWKDAEPSQALGLPDDVREHCNPFCRAVKCDQARMNRCQRDDIYEICRKAQEHCVLHKTCHAGVVEHALPFFVDGVFAGAFFIGPMRPSRRACPYPELRDRYAALPVLNAQRLRQATDALRPYVIAAASGLAELEECHPGPEADARILGALDYVRNNFDEAIVVDDAAAVATLSPSRFQRVFRDVVGEPFGRYLLNVRLRHARRLLTISDLPIGEIATACGFRTQAYFGSVFRREIGQTPSDFRHAQQQSLSV